MAQLNNFDYDLYDLFGVEDTATLDEIKKAYEIRNIKMHPDNFGNTPSSEERFERLQAGMEIFQCPNRRSVYDDYRSSQKPNGNKRKPSADEPCDQTRQEKRPKQTSSNQPEQQAPSAQSNQEDMNKPPTQKGTPKQWHGIFVAHLESRLKHTIERDLASNLERLEKIKADIEILYDYKPKTFWDPLLTKMEKNATVMSRIFKTRLSDAKKGRLSNDEMHKVPWCVNVLNMLMFHVECIALVVQAIIDDLKSLELPKSDAEKRELVSDIERQLGVWSSYGSEYDDSEYDDSECDDSEDDESEDDESEDDESEDDESEDYESEVDEDDDSEDYEF